MNKKLNKKIFSGVLALSFVFGSGLVSTVSENLGLEYSNVAYANYVWDIFKPKESKWIEIEYLVRAGYPYVFAEEPLKFTFKNDRYGNGKVHYDYYDSDKHEHIDKPLPDKGYTLVYSRRSNIGPTKDFLIDHGYEVMQETLHGHFADPYGEKGFEPNFYDADEVLIWRKKAASNDPSNYPTASTGIVRYSGEDLNVSDLYAGGRNLRGTNPVTFSDGKTSKKVDNVTKETTKEEKLKVTFSDDSTTELSVSYTIKPLSDKYTLLSKKIKANSKADLTSEKAKEAIVSTSVPSGSAFEFVDTTTDLNVGDNTRKVKVTYPDTSLEEVEVTVSYLPDDIKLEDYDKLNDTDKKLYSVIEFRNADKTTTMVRLKSVLNKGTVEAPKLESKAGYTVEWKLTAQ